MNIESKRYRMRSTGIAGQVEIRSKAGERSSYVHSQDLPSVHALALMKENDFDRLCAGLMK